MTDRFELHAPYQPSGDQPEAIRRLTAGFEAGLAAQTLPAGQWEAILVDNASAAPVRPEGEDTTRDTRRDEGSLRSRLHRLDRVRPRDPE